MKQKKDKKKKYYNQKSFIKGAIRRLFSRSPTMLSVLSKAIHPTIKGIRGGKQFICNKCKKTFAQKDVNIDHIKSIIRPNETLNDLDYNTLVERIFCDEKNLQTLCISCHKEKTKREKKLKIKFKNGK